MYTGSDSGSLKDGRGISGSGSGSLNDGRTYSGSGSGSLNWGGRVYSGSGSLKVGLVGVVSGSGSLNVGGRLSAISIGVGAEVGIFIKSSMVAGASLKDGAADSSGSSGGGSMNVGLSLTGGEYIDLETAGVGT